MSLLAVGSLEDQAASSKLIDARSADVRTAVAAELGPQIVHHEE